MRFIFIFEYKILVKILILPRQADNAAIPRFVG